MNHFLSFIFLFEEETNEIRSTSHTKLEAEILVAL